MLNRPLWRRFAFCMLAGFTARGIEIAPIPDPVTGEQSYTINTPAGASTFNVGHLGEASAGEPRPTPQAEFRPPSIFSAPLPTGSGARSLGVAGAFAAIADDATAASWNPAGLIKLERPEVSAVYRHTRTENQHYSENENFRVGENSYDSFGLNYLSVVIPNREDASVNVVYSLNYQEAYDFTQEFTADASYQASRSFRKMNDQTFVEEQFDALVFQGIGRFDVSITSVFTTVSSAALAQTIDTDVDALLDFRQEGVIEAYTPSAAVQLSPKLFIGGSFNYYQDGAYRGEQIRSESITRYSATVRNKTLSTVYQRTSGTYTENTVYTDPGDGFFPGGQSTNISTGTFAPFEDTTISRRTDVQYTEGVIMEENEYEDLYGYNGTIGFLYTVNEFLVLGGSVDLPWEAKATQVKTTKRDVQTYNEDRTRLISDVSTVESEEKDVSFHFPLFWNLGMVARWTPHLYSSFDVSQTLWSDFAFEVEGEGKTNPFDGTPHGQNPVDDTWTLKFGTEYLIVTEQTEIPLRFGLIYEERPAIGRPDEYYGFSLGSGISIGQGKGKVILDLAYSYLEGNGVKSLVPEETGLSTDTRIHQIYASAIWHF